MELSKKTEEALKWIVGILNKHNIVFRISGGFAAKIYGSNRELADIDIGIKEDEFAKILSEIEPFLVDGEPGHYKDDEWDLLGARINYGGQFIDLCVIDSLRFFSKRDAKWDKIPFDPKTFTWHDVCGIKIPIIAKKDLIEYKDNLRREVDLFDIDEMLKHKN